MKIEEKEWIIKFYKTETGKCPVDDFLQTLSKEDFEKMQRTITHLKVFGPKAHRPQCAKLRDDIYELRVRLPYHQTRTLYFFSFENYIVLTHIFIKKTDKVPDGEIEKAVKYKKDFLQRYNVKNIDEV